MKRRTFLRNIAWSTSALSSTPLIAYDFNGFINSVSLVRNPLKISLAQWSLHVQFFDGKLNPDDFATISMDTYGIEAVEYVNQFYTDSAEDEKFWNIMKDRANNAG